MVTIPKQQNKGCGYRNANGVSLRISDVDEMVAEFAEFPWMMAIMKDDKYLCGGALISDSVVVTVAHYVHNEPPYSLTVRAGEWDTKTIKEPLSHEERIVTRIIVHEQYHDEDENLFYDIALLFFLDHPLELKPNIQPICLPEPNTNFDHSRCFVTGWGKDRFGKEGIQQVILKKIELPIIPHDQCQDQFRNTIALGRYFELHETFICAGGEEGRDACEGDGGSPLVCPAPGHPNRYQLSGLVAWGIECGLRDVPGAYVNVGVLRTWIDDKLIAGGFDTALLETVNDVDKNVLSIIGSENKDNNRDKRQYDNGCAVNEVCVRSFQCINGTVNRDGRKIIQKRIGGNGNNAIVISKCAHYMDACCDLADYRNAQQTKPITFDIPEAEGCGQRNTNSLAPFGMKSPTEDMTSFAEFPWMVAILKDEEFVCGGALLSDSVVLTLATCVSMYGPRQLMVRAGEWDTQTVKEPFPHENRRVLKIIEHDNFTADLSHLNNIALLFLSRPFELKSHINSICLSKLKNIDLANVECLTTGWGAFNNPLADYNILRKTTWQISENVGCKTDTEASQCQTRNFESNRFTACINIDVGSPLVCKLSNASNRFQIIGIVIQCSPKGRQSIEVTSVPYFDTWLSDKISGWFNGTLQLDIRTAN